MPANIPSSYGQTINLSAVRTTAVNGSTSGIAPAGGVTFGSGISAITVPEGAVYWHFPVMKA